MMKLKQILLNVSAVLALALSIAPAASIPAYAACPSTNTAKGQVLQGLGQSGSNCEDKQVNGTFRVIVNIMSIIVGMMAVIAIIYAGFKYITSNGDANRVGAAKSTLIYALVGVAVAGLAQVLIHLVLTTTANTK